MIKVHLVEGFLNCSAIFSSKKIIINHFNFRSKSNGLMRNFNIEKFLFEEFMIRMNMIIYIEYASLLFILMGFVLFIYLKTFKTKTVIANFR